MKLIIYFLATLLLLTGCYNEKKAQRQFIKSLAYPKIAANYCESRYPCVDSVVIGDSVIRFDTLYLPSGDTIWLDSNEPIKDTMIVTKYKVCPPVKIITKLVHVTDTIKQTDKAALKSCQLDNSSLISQLNKRTSEYDVTKKGRSKWRLLCLITWGICATYIGLKFSNLKFPSIKLPQIKT